MKHATIYLKDGCSELDVWPRSFERIPTIGEFVSIDCPEAGFLRNYAKKAKVTMIELDPGNRTRIYLQAEPMVKAIPRTVILLNEDYIPQASRRAVERHLRKHLYLPVFEWTRSHQPRPVLGIHNAPASGQDQVRTLCAEVRNIIEMSECPTPV